MTVAELGQRISSRELTEWQLFYNVEPFGEERADLRAALICHIIYSMNRGKDSPDIPLEDFMPKFEKKEEVEAEEGSTALEALAEALGATVVRK